MKWIDKKSEVKPPKGRRPILCYCPSWNDSTYQVAYYDGNQFYYDEQPNDDFDEEVVSWTLFMEAD